MFSIELWKRETMQSSTSKNKKATMFQNVLSKKSNKRIEYKDRRGEGMKKEKNCNRNKNDT